MTCIFREIKALIFHFNCDQPSIKDSNKCHEYFSLKFRQGDDVVEADFYKSPHKNKQNNWIEKIVVSIYNKNRCQRSTQAPK